MVIIGFPHGTVNRGGGLYRINVETYEREQIPIPGHNNEATEFLSIEDGVLYYNGIQFIDGGQGTSEDYSGQITLKTE